MAVQDGHLYFSASLNEIVAVYKLSQINEDRIVRLARLERTLYAFLLLRSCTV